MPTALKATAAAPRLLARVLAQNLLTGLVAQIDANRPREIFTCVWRLANETLDEYSKDRGDLVAAALAFYTLLSLAPLIIVAVAIASIVLGRGAAHQEVRQLLENAMGAGAAASIDEWVLEASRTGGIATVIGAILTILAASRFVAQLRVALNQVWNIDVYVAEGFKSSVSDYLRRRAFAFGMVLASGPLLLVVFASRALLMGLGGALFPGSAWKGFLMQALQILISLLVVAAMTATVFRVVPDTRVGWRAIWRGATLTSVLFNVGNLLVGLYLGKASVGAAYGAAGSLVVILIWLYFSAQIFLYGAEFTQVYSTHYGRGLSVGERGEPRQVESEDGAAAPRT